MMLNTICRILALMALVTATVLAFYGDHAHAAYTIGLAIFNQLLAQEAA